MPRPLHTLEHLLRRALPAAWLFGHKHLGDSLTGDNALFRPPGVSLPPEPSNGMRPWWWLRMWVRWTLTFGALIAAATTAFRVLSILHTSPPTLSASARDSHASIELYVGSCFTLLIAAAALVFWIIHWINPDHPRLDWQCPCTYDRRGLPATAPCPECGHQAVTKAVCHERRTT